MNIDFVVTWVDMDDPVWKADFAKYAEKIDDSKNETSTARFRDYGFMKYWFRGVEKFAPWVRHIHFVTCGQKPEWLNADHPKLKLVDHKDYIPEKFLPCFNSSLIEIYLHKIPGIADRFVYFNDDFFIINHIEQERFFKNGLPCDIAAFQYLPPIGLWNKCMRNNIALINKHFDKREVTRRDGGKWYNKDYGKRVRLNNLLKLYPKFINLCVPHNAQPYLKKTYEDVWQNCGEELTAMSHNRFRSDRDYTQELFRTWQICKSDFEPYNTYGDTKMFPLITKPKRAVEAVKDQSYKLVCLNDNAHIRNYEEVMGEIKNAFENILPERSGFER